MAQAWVRIDFYKKHDHGADIAVPLRELIAATVLHGLTSGMTVVSTDAAEDRELIERMADRAVVAADALIDRLAKE